VRGGYAYHHESCPLVQHHLAYYRFDPFDLHYRFAPPHPVWFSHRFDRRLPHHWHNRGRSSHQDRYDRHPRFQHKDRDRYDRHDRDRDRHRGRYDRDDNRRDRGRDRGDRRDRRPRPRPRDRN
jgi:hypothetical protein